MRNGARETLETWSDESERDRRNVRWAFVVAVVLHALFFRLQLPETVAAEPQIRKPIVFPIQTARFSPPPPREQQTIPERRTRRVPWPDPTPDDPEPLMVPEEIETPRDLYGTDLVLGLPKAPPPPPPPGAIRVGGNVVAPVKIHAPPPRYPEIARKARIQGVVFVEAIIDTDGNVRQVELIKGLPMGLSEATLQAVRGWRFEPATLNGRPVAVIYMLQVRFELS